MSAYFSAEDGARKLVAKLISHFRAPSSAEK
jgi:hypothetical protein